MPPVDRYPELADLIKKQLPYGDAVTLPPLGTLGILDMLDTDVSELKTKIMTAFYEDNHVVARTGLHETETAADHKGFKPSDDFTFAERMKLLHWRFGNVDYDVTKAIRIWYNYGAVDDAGQPIIDPATGEQRQVGTFLLIGYVGNGQP